MGLSDIFRELLVDADLELSIGPEKAEADPVRRARAVMNFIVLIVFVV
jgi:hypothetical protein